jgi:hypothetical protein
MIKDYRTWSKIIKLGDSPHYPYLWNIYELFGWDSPIISFPITIFINFVSSLNWKYSLIIHYRRLSNITYWYIQKYHKLKCIKYYLLMHSKISQVEMYQTLSNIIKHSESLHLEILTQQILSNIIKHHLILLKWLEKLIISNWGDFPHNPPFFRTYMSYLYGTARLFQTYHKLFDISNIIKSIAQPDFEKKN